jgi:predicted phage tail component-like protein
MRYFVLLNDISSLDLNLKVVKRPIIPSPNRNYNEIPIQGRNGNLIEDLGTYQDIKIPIQFNFIERCNMYDAVRKIMFWLSNKNDSTLSFADDIDYFYKVKRLEYTDIERQYKIKGSFTITFVCEAFRYYKDSPNIVITSNNYSFYSPELAYTSEPIINVYGSGNITLTLNGLDVQLKNINNNIIVDSVREESYNSTYDNLSESYYGEYLKLINGPNKISWIGNISKIELQPNWRCL